MRTPTPPATPTDRVLAGKVSRARWAMVLEQLWVRLWMLAATAGLFAVVSLLGVWPLLSETGHAALLALFALGAAAAFVSLARIRWPTREDAIRRIEAVSGIAHRPASSYEDTLSAPAHDPATLAIWQAHKARMAALLARLRSGTPRPRTDRYDPFALRALLVLSLALLAALAGEGTIDRMRDAFRFGADRALLEARLDAWVSPPPYTAKPPVMLADGANPIGRQAPDAATAAEPQILEVPQKSTLIVRVTGLPHARLKLVLSAEGQAAQFVDAKQSIGGGDVAEIRTQIDKPAKVRVLADATELAHWTLAVIPDALPQITLTKPPERTARGSMKLSYKVEDDYGVAAASVKLDRVAPKPADPATSWARIDLLKGPRPPKRRPPVLALRVPQAGAKDAGTSMYLEFAKHPWAGQKVIMTLEAKDVAGQTGRSDGIEIVLPERRFTKPLARALVEQRRKLLDDYRYRPHVLTALDALTASPDGFIDDVRIYLGIRTTFHRLNGSRARSIIDSVIEQLWYLALKIEDGDLSEAERALLDAQDRLSKALEEGASEEELERLMAELREALDTYMQEMAKAAEDQAFPDGQNEQQQIVGQQDLERMMKNLEDLAKSGAREQAQQMLSEMRDLMERMQAGRMNESQAQKSQQMMEMMGELGDVAGNQQQLMDDTFSAQRQQGGPQQGQQGQSGQQQGQRGQMGQRGDRRGQQGMPGQRGQQGRGKEQGKQGEGGQDDQGQGEGRDPGVGQTFNPGQLAQRQRELRDRLDKLQRDMRERGLGPPDGLDGAREAMEGAEQALESGNFDEATEQQGQALDQLRQSAQSMAQEMLQNMPQRYGQSGESPRDPLGRPQRSEGPDLGTSVKVPDQIDIQRAREILEELRRRLGEATRPPVELDYLERLLRRF